MSDIKFACTNCQQHIQCEPGYAGMEIACPACQSKILVPGAPAAPAPAPALRMAAPPAPAPMPVQAAVAATCPNCGNTVAPQAIMCIKCGTNLKTGQKMGAPGRPGSRAVAASIAAPSVWYKTPYPYLGVFLLVMVALYFLGQSNPLMKIAFLLGLLFYLVAAHIAVTVCAFKDDGVGKGFLCLFIGIYTIHYAFRVSERDFLKVIYGIACLLGLILYFVPLK